MQNKEFSRKIQPKIHSIKPIESEELENLGAEIEEELTAKEKAEIKAKLTPQEQIANFYNSDEWVAWTKIKDSAIESIDKANARNKVLQELDSLEKQVPNDNEALKAISLIRDEVIGGHA